MRFFNYYYSSHHRARTCRDLKGKYHNYTPRRSVCRGVLAGFIGTHSWQVWFLYKMGFFKESAAIIQAFRLPLPFPSCKYAEQYIKYRWSYPILFILEILTRLQFYSNCTEIQGLSGEGRNSLFLLIIKCHYCNSVALFE